MIEYSPEHVVCARQAACQRDGTRTSRAEIGDRQQATASTAPTRATSASSRSGFFP
ncbi:hypothetical protein FOMPIDRAFT_1026121, partial [Fomitopsis schrenkii]